MKLIREEIETVDFIVEEKNGKKSNGNTQKRGSQIQ
jgi:hypothetical protein